MKNNAHLNELIFYKRLDTPIIFSNLTNNTSFFYENRYKYIMLSCLKDLLQLYYMALQITTRVKLIYIYVLYSDVYIQNMYIKFN
jgi:hypothetical protein